MLPLHYARQDKMQKDLKIGFVAGIVIVAALGLWLATKPRTVTEARLTELRSAADEYRPPVPGPEPSNPVGEKNPAGQQYPKTPKPIEKNLENTAITGERSKLMRQNGAARDKSTKKERLTIIHTVKKGETLCGISKQYYGTENEWDRIFNANRNRIIDANKLRPGTRITIP